VSSLIQIQYGLDSNGNPLSVLINPELVGSYQTSITNFYIFIDSVNSSSVLSSATNFQTLLDFYAVTGSIGSTGAGNYMEALFNNSVLSPEAVSPLDFYTPGFFLSQTVLSS
jgi:hypothetical protein